MGAAASLAAQTITPILPAGIQVVEKGTGWPVPLIELRTTHHLRLVSDNAGMIAIDQPDLLNREVWFDVLGHGYEAAADAFGRKGVRITPIPGKVTKFEVQRTIIAKRLGRLTGAGLFAESQKLGLEKDWKESGIVGSDSVQTAIYQGKLFWIWGDTTLARYPLGIFDCGSATSPLQTLKSLEPPLRYELNYFRDARGNPRGVAPMPGPGPTWAVAYCTLPDASGKQRLVCSYMKIKPPMQIYEWGLAAWNDAKENFESVRTIWKKDEGAKQPPVPTGHAAFWKDEQGREWVLFGNPFPSIKCPATFEAWKDPSQWEVLETPKSLQSPENRPVRPHSGSIAWNPHRQRWVTIFMEGPISGSLWYAESKSPFGPWGKTVKVLAHQNYVFYNPLIHPELLESNSSSLLFEGTYTFQFTNNKEATPRYEYNQMLYRLDLDDPKLAPAQEQ